MTATIGIQLGGIIATVLVGVLVFFNGRYNTNKVTGSANAANRTAESAVQAAGSAAEAAGKAAETALRAEWWRREQWAIDTALKGQEVGVLAMDALIASPLADPDADVKLGKAVMIAMVPVVKVDDEIEIRET